MHETMKRIRPFLIAIFFFIALVIQPQGGARSQTTIVNGKFKLGTENGPLEVPFSFNPNGGAMTFGGGSVHTAENSGSCYGITSIAGISGTFVGGDGGEASGTWTETYYFACDNEKDPDKNRYWTWKAHLYADGHGDGNAISDDIPANFITFTYSAAEFQAVLQPVITSEYIYNTYGIRVEDSFGNDQYAQKSWSDHELVLLNDVLKNLPPGFLSKISLDRIVRNAAFINSDGTADPNTFGAYYPCDRAKGAKCNGSLPTLRVFDLAETSTLDFPGDHDREFKATILHELIHAYQYKKDNNSVYANPYNSPQTQNYMEATRPLKGEEAHKWQNGWKWHSPPPKWILFTDQNDKPPTLYGIKVNPIEDMSESAMMYVYDPARLQASSTARYNYIRDNIFGGVEYDNGTPK